MLPVTKKNLALNDFVFYHSISLVREIAVLHGGSVTVESSSENGTTFAVTLPLAQRC